MNAAGWRCGWRCGWHPLRTTDVRLLCARLVDLPQHCAGVRWEAYLLVFIRSCKSLVVR